MSEESPELAELDKLRADLDEARNLPRRLQFESERANIVIGKLREETLALRAQLLRCKPFVEAPLSVIPLGEREAILREVFGGKSDTT